MSVFEVASESFMDMNHGPVHLCKRIGWAAVESALAEYNRAVDGRPSVPVRTIGGMMLLKSIHNLNDEGVVARWLENPHIQHFTGGKCSGSTLR